jgi:M6 family metalloprotease-like protein
LSNGAKDFLHLDGYAYPARSNIMKKNWFAIFALAAAMTLCSACSFGRNSSHDGGDICIDSGSLPDDETDSSSDLPDDSSDVGDSSPSDSSDTGNSSSSDSSDIGNSSSTSCPDEPEWSDDNAVNWTDPDITPDDEKDPPAERVLYTQFTDEEKALLQDSVCEVIPFLANYEYGVAPRIANEANDYSQGIHFYTKDNTEEEFANYRKVLSKDYRLTFEETDDYGDVWYTYQKGKIVLELTCYLLNGHYFVDVYAYNTLYLEETDYLYNDFIGREKRLFAEFVGEVIPFLPTDEYYVEGYYYDDPTDFSQGICFYTYDNTEAEFDAYRKKLSGYTLRETYQDILGDTWYVYEKGTIEIETCGYYTESDYYGTYYTVDIYVRNSAISGEDEGDVGIRAPEDWEDPDGSGEDSGNSGGSTDSSGSGESSGEGSDEDSGGTVIPDTDGLMSNHGKGLPSGENGLYTVDFSKAVYAKNVTELGYYIDGCPTVGNVKVLVIPVEFSDVTAASKGYSTAKINTAFNGKAGSTDYYSVSEYYSIASYGQLSLSFTVLDEWFRPQHSSDYYLNAKIDYFDEKYEGGDMLIMDEALSYLSAKMDLAEFDSDQNGTIDAVVMVNTLDINYDVTMQWAYRFWNIYTDENQEYFEYDGVSANDYMWASYQFLLEGYDHNGNQNYSDSRTNTYTFLHEFGHVLGADDYYDTAYISAPMDGNDIMDSALGDHNAYTKFHYGWLTSSKLVVAEDSLTVDLTAFDKSGDTLIIANNWDESLGVYQEYYIVVYYRNTLLNTGGGGYFSEDGILVYHVNATLQKSVEYDETYYDVYNNNTDPDDPDEFGTENNLIEYVPFTDNCFIYLQGDSLSKDVKDDSGNKIAYVFTVDSISGEKATLTFRKNQ